MTFESVFTGYENTQPVCLADDKDVSIHLVQEEPFYITPAFSDLRLNKDSRLMVVSAPGATGKSALAKYLAYKYSSVYWNLAEITLGDNSFVGTIVRSVGAENYSHYINRLLSGETFLIIDAFDEAEMISGVKAVRSFIQEIIKTVKNSKSPSVILLARAETAYSICTNIEESGIPYSHYEISYFERNQSEAFVKEIAIKEGFSGRDLGMLDNCVRQYLDNIYRLVHEENISSFAGYAPVLEVIGKHVASETNAFSFLLSLKNEKMSSIDVIEKILLQLLTREKEKVKEGFSKRINDKLEGRELPLEDVYNIPEQMNNLISYVLFHDFDMSGEGYTRLPEDIREEYLEICKTFVPQHPFLRSSSEDGKFDFAGPAFRDFILANLMESDNNEELLSLYLEEKRIDHHFPSHLLWKFYTNHDDVKIPSQHVAYLFESFRSQTKGDLKTSLCIDGSEDTDYSSLWAIEHEKGNNDSSENYELICKDHLLWFENLNNINIDVDDVQVKLSNHSNNVQISQSNVRSKTIEIIADRVVFDVYKGMDSSLVSTSDVKIQTGSGGMTDILINGDNLFIDFPNVDRYFKLIKYKYKSKDESPFSDLSFAYILRKILVQFRKHKKDTPARDAEKIDYVIIGGDENRQKVFNFLIKSGIIYRDDQEPHLYKLNTQQLAQFGISWGAINHGDIRQLENAYNEFIKIL